MSTLVIVAMAAIGCATKVARLFASDHSAGTAIEYGLIAGVIGLGIVATVGVVETEVNGLFEFVRSAFP